jgi:hypothetical protein
MKPNPCFYNSLIHAGGFLRVLVVLPISLRWPPNLNSQFPKYLLTYALPDGTLPHVAPLRIRTNPPLTVSRPPASPAISIACTLPFLEYFQPTDSELFAHSSKKHGGIPSSFPFRNSHSPKPLKRTPLQRGRSDDHAQFGARRPRAAFNQRSQANKFAIRTESGPTRGLRLSHNHSVHLQFATHSQTARDHIETNWIEP